MGELKSPLGMMAGRCLVPWGLAAGAQDRSGSGVPCRQTCPQDACHCLVPCDLGHSGLGVPCSLVPLTLTWRWCLLFVLVRSCSFSFALVACIVSRCFAWAFLGLGLRCFGRVGLRFWVSGLFVRPSLLSGPGPACSPWLAWVFA